MRSDKDPIFKNRKKDIKALLINPFGIGDVLFSTPLLAILKKNFPHSSLYFICNKRTRDILDKAPELEGVYVFEKDDYKRLWKKNPVLAIKEFIILLVKIKKKKFDLAIDMSMGHQYSFFLKLLNIPERVGFDYKKRGRFLTRKLKFDGFNDKPIAEYYKDLLRLLGLEVTEEPTKIWLTPEDKAYVDNFFKKERLNENDAVIGMSPGGGVSFGRENWVFKRWPHENFARLAERLIKDAGLKVVLIWGPGEEALVKDITESMSLKPIISPATTIRQMAELMSRCNCVVCNDGGPLHVAVACGGKTVSIFGPSDQNVYGPYPKNDRHLPLTKDIGCRPCYKNFKLPNCASRECLNGLDAGEVFLAVTGHIGNKI